MEHRYIIIIKISHLLAILQHQLVTPQHQLVTLQRQMEEILVTILKQVIVQL